MIRPSRDDLERFRSLLAHAAGLRFDDDKLAVLAEVMTARIKESGSPSAASYLARASGSGELAELARALTVSETYLFRDPDQLRAFEALLREREASGARHLRVLSAGCSSGEEAYSIAITIRETLRDLPRWAISIVGLDLNPEVIARARLASYTRWSLRGAPEPIRDKYFERRHGRYLLIDPVRAMASFEEDNLVRPRTAWWRAEGFDVVFCRNVLMYLSREAAREVVGRFARCLAPGGHLFLGHAENLRGVSGDFHLRHTHGTFYYSRREIDVRAERPPAAEALDSRPAPPPAPARDDRSWFEAISRASERIERISRDTEATQPSAPPEALRADPGLATAMDLMRQERFEEAMRSLDGEPDEPDSLILRAMLQVSTGDLAGAERLCQELLEIDELNAGAHYILAMAREHFGDREAAVEHSQAAAYLDSEFAMPHLQLGRLARRRGDLATARRELELAEGLLSRENAARIILFGGGFKRETLVELCRAELRACGDEL